MVDWHAAAWPSQVIGWKNMSKEDGADDPIVMRMDADAQLRLAVWYYLVWTYVSSDHPRAGMQTLLYNMLVENK